MNFIILFIICTAVNVILNTVKSILTVNGGKMSAAVINAVTFGFYTYIVILTANDGLGTFPKMVITAVVNFIGVYIVKLVEQKMRKDKLWKVEFTVHSEKREQVKKMLSNAGISHSAISVSPNWTLISCYCETQKQSLAVKEIVTAYNAKYFASETKLL